MIVLCIQILKILIVIIKDIRLNLNMVVQVSCQTQWIHWMISTLISQTVWKIFWILLFFNLFGYLLIKFLFFIEKSLFWHFFKVVSCFVLDLLHFCLSIRCNSIWWPLSLGRVRCWVYLVWVVLVLSFNWTCIFTHEKIQAILNCILIWKQFRCKQHATCPGIKIITEWVTRNSSPLSLWII